MPSDQPPYDLTGLVLAGGRSRRMGRSKAGLLVGDQALVDRVLGPLGRLCREVIIITRDITEFLEYRQMVVQDLVPGQGPLGGLATGLFYARFPWSLTLACDLPFLKPEILDLIARKTLGTGGGPRAVVPRTTLGWEPLVAAYSRACLTPVLRLLDQGERALDKLSLSGVRWQSIPEHELRAVDPDLDSFTNLNTPEELERARIRLTPK
ncbi:MAG: molybdenum cofactor guanylyltransferase [Thermodesulfobacteriota bacterium]